MCWAKDLMAWWQNSVDERALLIVVAQLKSGTSGAAHSRLCSIDVVAYRIQAIHFSLAV
jgi:hypothetical protein